MWGLGRGGKGTGEEVRGALVGRLGIRGGDGYGGEEGEKRKRKSVHHMNVYKTSIKLFYNYVCMIAYMN